MRTYIAAIMLWACTTSAQAAVFDIGVSFSGGQLGAVSFDVRLDADLMMGDIAPTTSGLTINALSFVPAGGFGYRYVGATGSVMFFGLENDEIIIGSDSDFFVVIGALATMPSIISIADSSALIPNAIGSPTSTTLSVTPVSPVPLPTSSLLLLVGLGGIASLKRRKRHPS